MGHPIPAGRQAITPHLVIRGASRAIEFYERAFAAQEVYRMAWPAGDGSTKVMHAELKIGGSTLFLADDFPEHGSTGPEGCKSPVSIHLCVEDADATFARAVEAGAVVSMPLMDAPWGDRYGQLLDPFGHRWSIAEHLEDVSPEQVRERMACFAGQPCT